MMKKFSAAALVLSMLWISPVAEAEVSRIASWRESETRPPATTQKQMEGQEAMLKSWKKFEAHLQNSIGATQALASVTVLPVPQTAQSTVQPVLVTAMTSAAAPTQMPEVNPVRMAVPAVAVAPANAAVKAGSLVSAQTGNGNRPSGADTLRDLFDAVADVDLLLENHPQGREYRNYGRIERIWDSMISYVSTGDCDGGTAILEALQQARVALNIQLDRREEESPSERTRRILSRDNVSRLIAGIQYVHDHGWPQPYMFNRPGEPRARNVIQEARTGFRRSQEITTRIDVIRWQRLRQIDAGRGDPPEWPALQRERSALEAERDRILNNIRNDMNGSLAVRGPSGPNPAQRVVMEMMLSLAHFDELLDMVRTLRGQAWLFRNDRPNSNTGGQGTGR